MGNKIVGIVLKVTAEQTKAAVMSVLDNAILMDTLKTEDQIVTAVFAEVSKVAPTVSIEFVSLYLKPRISTAEGLMGSGKTDAEILAQTDFGDAVIDMARHIFVNQKVDEQFNLKELEPQDRQSKRGRIKTVLEHVNAEDGEVPTAKEFTDEEKGYLHHDIQNDHSRATDDVSDRVINVLKSKHPHKSSLFEGKREHYKGVVELKNEILDAIKILHPTIPDVVTQRNLAKILKDAFKGKDLSDDGATVTLSGEKKYILEVLAISKNSVDVGAAIKAIMNQAFPQSEWAINSESHYAAHVLKTPADTVKHHLGDGHEGVSDAITDYLANPTLTTEHKITLRGQAQDVLTNVVKDCEKTVPDWVVALTFTPTQITDKLAPTVSSEDATNIESALNKIDRATGNIVAGTPFSVPEKVSWNNGFGAAKVIDILKLWVNPGVTFVPHEAQCDTYVTITEAEAVEHVLVAPNADVTRVFKNEVLNNLSYEDKKTLRGIEEAKLQNIAVLLGKSPTNGWPLALEISIDQIIDHNQIAGADLNQYLVYVKSAFLKIDRTTGDLISGKTFSVLEKTALKNVLGLESLKTVAPLYVNYGVAILPDITLKYSGYRTNTIAQVVEHVLGAANPAVTTVFERADFNMDLSFPDKKTLRGIEEAKLKDIAVLLGKQLPNDLIVALKCTPEEIANDLFVAAGQTPTSEGTEAIKSALAKLDPLTGKFLVDTKFSYNEKLVLLNTFEHFINDNGWLKLSDSGEKAFNKALSLQLDYGTTINVVISCDTIKISEIVAIKNYAIGCPDNVNVNAHARLWNDIHDLKLSEREGKEFTTDERTVVKKCFGISGNGIESDTDTAQQVHKIYRDLGKGDQMTVAYIEGLLVASQPQPSSNGLWTCSPGGTFKDCLTGTRLENVVKLRISFKWEQHIKLELSHLITKLNSLNGDEKLTSGTGSRKHVDAFNEFLKQTVPSDNVLCKMDGKAIQDAFKRISGEDSDEYYVLNSENKYILQSCFKLYDDTVGLPNTKVSEYVTRLEGFQGDFTASIAQTIKTMAILALEDSGVDKSQYTEDNFKAVVEDNDFNKKIDINCGVIPGCKSAALEAVTNYHYDTGL